MKKIKIFLAAISVALFSIAGCSNLIEESDSNSYSQKKYGSISIVQDSEEVLQSSRAIDVDTLKTSTVTVSGAGMDDIVKENVAISGGKGSFSVENILVGKNRIVTVKSNVDGAVIRALADVNEGNGNTVSVSWSTTALANVYYELLIAGVNISTYGDAEKDAIQKMIPKDTHASLVNAEKIASDFKNGTSSGSYLLNYGTVTVSASNVNGYTVQVTDVASEKKTVSGDSESFELKAYPGEWKVFAYDSSNTKICEKDVVVVSGKETKISLSYSAGGSGYDFSNKTIIFVKANSAPDIWAWEDGAGGVALTQKAGGTWNKSSAATKMTAVTSEYMADGSGWYMIDYSSYATGKTIKFKLNWADSELLGKAGTFWYDGSSSTETNPSPAIGEPGVSISVINPDVPVAAARVYVSADSAPTIWLWQESGKATTALMGYSWTKQPVMKPAADLNYNAGWYVFELDSNCYTAGKDFTFILNSNSGNIDSGKSATFWYDAKGLCGAEKAFYDSDPTTKPEPVKPSVKLKPADGSKVRTTDSISVIFTDGNDTISFASVEINGTSYDMGTTAGTFTKSLKDLGITTDNVPINVSASVTNGQGTTTVSAAYTSRYVDPSKVDVFTWDNVNAYFVLTDRFYNGDTTNDHSYYRKNGLSGDENVATFHGGDIAGLTQKLDYFDKLGVNAIWITAPYEQAHGWVGGKNGAFPHYAFHGYYTLDWTSMDQNMGTVEDLRTFVNACHSKGIRVIMDVVMNHVGYNNTQDMVTFNHGYTEHTENGWLEKTTNPKSGQVEWYANDTVKWENSYWDSSWFGPWIRSFGYASGSEYGGSCGGLPDVKTELTSSVGMAPVLLKKWNEVDSDDYKAKYYNPSVANADWNGYSGDYRTDKNIAPADYQVVWLSAWVRELGIDGFRCDTAKHVEPFRWGQLKVACEAALEAWRNDSSKDKTYKGADTGAEDWDESFWMTGECFGWTSTAGQGDYYTTGKFDSMINFSFNGAAGSGTSSSYPSSNTWESYLNINKNGDSDENGNRNNVLTYVSSHDTRLCRASNQSEVGTMLTLLPGGVQIYYGDETSRPLAYTGCGDTDMMTRGDFNWAAAAGETAKHWGKVGTFRKFNPAVGAGIGSATKRTYSGPAGESKVAIGISGSSVDVKDLFTDGTTVYNWYDGASAVVSGGKVTFAGGTASQPILVSDKNPADYGVEF